MAASLSNFINSGTMSVETAVPSSASSGMEDPTDPVSYMDQEIKGGKETIPSISSDTLGSKSLDDEKKLIDYDALYEQVKKKTQEFLLVSNYEEKDVQHPSLLPTLRPYQSKAVNWMISQEIHSKFKGGILADEMGLGKTVEVLALVLNRPRDSIVYPEFLKIESEAVAMEITDQEKTDEEIVEFPVAMKVIKQDKINEEDYDSPPKKSKIDFTLRQRLTAHYNNALAEYSCLKSLLPKEKVIIDEPKILCICAKTEISEKLLVACQKCKRIQHADCVHYDFNDPERGCYFCPECWTHTDPVQSGATLIITPASITSQWTEEIHRHLKDHLNVLLYKGVNGQGYCQPTYLAKNYDVIIVSYDTLRTELRYVEAVSAQSRNLRKAPTYIVPRCPLMSIEFWRVCLDEAQMVEGSQSAAAKMARKLNAVHRWCVTGTPIQKSIHDLYGLFLFLGVQTPKSVLYNTAALVDLLATIFWRTRKTDVSDQVCVPEQKELAHWLTFSPVEKHFYEEEEPRSLEKFSDRLKKFYGDDQMKLSSVDPHTRNVLLLPLLRLRQACVHPQMVKNKFQSLRIPTRTMTMEELLLLLIKRAQLECEENHRLRVAAANGLAAMHAIKEEWELAAEKYRDVLRWSEDLKNSIKTDTIQLLHTMHNLADVLSSAPAGAIPPTLRDSSLLEEVQQLRRHYLERASAQVEAAQSVLAPLTAKVAILQTELDSSTLTMNDFWWNVVCNWASDLRLAEKLVEEFKEKLQEETADSGAHSSFEGIRTLHALKYLLGQRLEEISGQREKIGTVMRMLEVTSTEKLANEAADCHLRSETNRKGNICLLCKTKNDLEDYESLLFRMEDRKNRKEVEEDEDWNSDEEDTPTTLEAPRRGTWADGETERVLKLLLQFARKNHAPLVALESGTIHLNLMEAYKKEFRNTRIVWRQLYDQASAVDELSMATIRYRLRLPHELPQRKADSKRMKDDLNKPSPIYLLEKHEVDFKKSQLQGDLISATNCLTRQMGRVSYLKNLEKAGYGKSGSQNVDPCPLCTMQLGYHWSTLSCGHCFCMDCISKLLGNCRGLTMKCGICRTEVRMDEISYVDARPGVDDSGDQIEIKGSHSTKVEAILKKLLMIRREDPSAKCLIFSAWTEVLVIVGRAMNENDIAHCSLYGGKDKKKELAKFKNDPSIVVLLLPINTGANGLNLTEATHIMLVEPVLNPGNELQAIGRIHRFGQTKPTFVHKFLIRGTIEEKMVTMLEKHRSALSSRSAGSIKENPVTVADLRSLLIVDLPQNRSIETPSSPKYL